MTGGLGEDRPGRTGLQPDSANGRQQVQRPVLLSYAGEWAQSSNLDDELRSFGINEVPGLIKNWDTNFSLGGPIK